MAEYIEREALLNRFSDKGPVGRSVRDYIKDQPAADVAPVVHGKWEFPTMFGYRAFHIPHCSACGGVPCGVDENTKFCPNCGARMDGE